MFDISYTIQFYFKKNYIVIMHSKTNRPFKITHNYTQNPHKICDSPAHPSPLPHPPKSKGNSRGAIWYVEIVDK
jgi:hypothetical protein